MQKYRFCSWLIFVLVLGLYASLWAQEKDVPLQSKGQLTQMRSKFGHKPKQMENSPLLQKEGITPLTPDFWISQNVPKVHRVITGTGAIQGHVTQASGGDPIEGVWIQADQLFCPYDGWGTSSDFDGYYVIDLLPAGEYMVSTENESVFVDVYWDNKQDENSADTVTVASDATTDNIDFSLEEGGKITGLITLPGATSIQVTVVAKNITSGWEYYGWAYNPSGSSATYVINGLPTGSYKVRTYNTQGYLDKYYNNKPDESSADAVGVTLGLTTTGINFTLSLGGKITGTVTLPGASSVSATVYATNTTTGDYYTGSASGSGSSAAYEIIGLPTGTYKVHAYAGKYIDEYYNNKPDETSADLVSVTAGGTTSSIDFTLDLGGIIKGTISSSTKGPLNNIPVYAYSTTNHLSSADIDYTDASGNYRLIGLRSGYYKLFASGDTTYAFRYYNNKSSWSVADSVSVTAPDSATNKNFSLEVGGSISGFVYGDGGVPVSDAYVYVFGNGFFDTWSLLKLTLTSANGSYKIGGLHTGKYTVLALIECDQMWYNNKPIWSPPDSVPVTMLLNTTGINFNFPSAVEDEEEITQRPSEFELYQNYPNPFNPETKIEYALKKTGHVTLHIYNVLGEKVKTLLDQDQPAGFYQINWDGKNDNGKPVSSGLYLYKLEVNGFSEAKRMILLK